jgi:hypothetical protein
MLMGVIVAATVGAGPTPAPAATHAAATCHLSDVQKVVAAAADGDTIQIPAGTCSWTSSLAIDAAKRSLEILGAGIGATVITAKATAFQVKGQLGRGLRLSGFTLIADHGDQENIRISGTSASWRVDHIKFIAGNGNKVPLRNIYVGGRTYGVIDHCVMTGDAALAIVVDGEDWATWRQPQKWGTAEAVFIEDNTFKVTPHNQVVANGATDCERGGRFVFRHNTTYNQIAQCHGFDSGGVSSCMSMEVYGNKGYIKTGSTWSLPWLGQIRGGTALWFDNTWEVDSYSFPPAEKGVWLEDAVALRVYRAEGSPYGWKPCDGTPLRLCSNIDAGWNLLDQSWWPLTCTSDADCAASLHHGTKNAVCKWRVCSGNGMSLCDPKNGDADCAAKGLGTCSAFVDGPGDGTPCFMQPGRSTDNTLSPTYEWNNSCVGAQPTACVGGLGSGNVHYGENVPQLKENVDYYNFKPKFDGKAGTGRGTLAQRPGTCTPLVAYWATDTKTLYRCENKDTWKPYYKPYPYPHPLTLGAAPSPDGGPVSPDAGPMSPDSGTAKPACGDGKLDPGETCDPPSSCPQSCDDSDPCTADIQAGSAATCDVSCAHKPITGCCQSAAECDDGNSCTEDSCSQNVCKHVPVPGCCASDADCADTNPCTRDSCDAGTGLCSNQKIAGCCAFDTDCADGDPCTLDTCDTTSRSCEHEGIPGCGGQNPDAGPADAGAAVPGGEPGGGASGCAVGSSGPVAAGPLLLVLLLLMVRRGRVLLAFILVALLPGRVLAQPLPEGSSGIAASYPGDKGIAGDPKVVFADDFEAVSGTKLSVAGSKWDNVYGDLVITQQSQNVHGGKKAIEITQTQPASNGAWRDFKQSGFDTLFVRYYMKYHAQFPGCHHTGMIIMAGAPGVTVGSATGVRPNGSNHFIASLDDIAPFFSWSPPNNKPPGFAYVYCYHMDQVDVWGDVFLPSGDVLPGSSTLSFGSAFVPRPNIILDRDRWYSFELMLKANTPGNSDGRIAFWIDGKLSADFMNLRLRSVNTLKPNVVNLSVYSSQNHSNKTVWYDDVVVATSYIGPMVTAPTPTPDAGPQESDGPAAPDAGGPDSGTIPACGNGKLDPGETCDPPSSCPQSCDDNNPCTSDVPSGSAAACNASCVHKAITGCCQSAAQCDDGNSCTKDSCSQNVCKHEAVPGCCQSDADCADTNPCTRDRCEAGTGLCSNEKIAGCCAFDTDCADDDPCTLDTCDATSRSCTHASIAGCCATDGCVGDPDSSAGAVAKADAGAEADAGAPGHGLAGSSLNGGCAVVGRGRSVNVLPLTLLLLLLLGRRRGARGRISRSRSSCSRTCRRSSGPCRP